MINFPEKQKKRSINGRLYVEKKYDWTKAGNTFVKAYEELIDK